MVAVIPQNDALAVAERALLALRAAIASGEEDAPATDRLRDEFEFAFRNLSPLNQRRVQRLSAELDVLVDDEIERPAHLRKRQLPSVSDVEKTVRELFRAQRWDDLLDLLRDNCTLLSPERRAGLRAATYNHLGRYEPALAFLRKAISLNPVSPLYRAAMISLLGIAGRDDELRQLLAETEQAQEVPAMVLVTAASTLLRGMRKLSPFEARELAERVIRITQRALKASPKGPMPAHVVRSAAFAFQGYAYNTLEQYEEAVGSFLNAVTLHSARAELWMSLGLLALRTDMNLATTAFAKAIALGVRDPFAYLFLAAEALEGEDWNRLLNLAKEGLEIVDSRTQRAVFFNYQAIARFELGAKAKVVERDFEEAIELDPDNAQIKRNHAHMRARAEAQEAELKWNLAGNDTEVSPRIADFADVESASFANSAFAMS